MHFYKPLLIALLLIFISDKLFATHYYGIDLFYTHVTGNTYRVSIVAFGDCSGAQFPSFSTTKPRIYIKKGTTNVFTAYLDQEPPKAGIEVTNGCPADLKRTTCVDPNGTVPGVKKFVYSKEFTLPSAAADWQFVYLGETDGTTIAGRSNSLTNVSPVGVISLVATLDNTKHPNSSPQFSSIATQFYCINSPVNYNPGAADADGDNLVYELVPALNGSSTITYVPGYSSSNPLAVSPGTFNFSSSTGQLAFTPNLLQKSLVVYRISEYRNGELMGTVMREMTMVVLPCINNPPAGYISNASGATIIDSVTVETCIGNHEIAFDINPTDANLHIINMVAKDLPKDSRLDITDNNTTHPQSRFVWNMTDLPEGDYTFYVTYTDDGCPASQKTQVYTVRLAHKDIIVETIPAECRTKGHITVTAPAEWSPWTYKVYDDMTPIFLGISLTNTWSDSLVPGTYSIQAINKMGCTAGATVEIPTNCNIADLPTAFSPNGDGKNDILYVRGINIKDLHLRIYNRWGQLIFESYDANKGWDGKFRGQDVPIEAYAFVLSVVFNNNEVFHKQGNITLLR